MCPQTYSFSHLLISGWCRLAFDISVAYLQSAADSTFEVPVMYPKGYEMTGDDGESLLAVLQKPLYGHPAAQQRRGPLLTDHITTATRTVLLHSCSRYPGTLDWTSLRNDTISRNRRNLQNRNSAAAGIAIRFGPKILLKCDRRQTGPKYPCTGLDDGYKSSFSLNHHYVQSLRPAHCHKMLSQ